MFEQRREVDLLCYGRRRRLIRSPEGRKDNTVNVWPEIKIDCELMGGWKEG